MSKVIGYTLIGILTVGYACYMLTMIMFAGKLGRVITKEVKVISCRAECRLYERRGLPLPDECIGYCK